MDRQEEDLKQKCSLCKKTFMFSRKDCVKYLFDVYFVQCPHCKQSNRVRFSRG